MTVEQYRRWLEQGREAPPVRLIRDGDVYFVRDGRHRIAAARAAGYTAIEADVLDPDALPRLERRHGLRSSRYHHCDDVGMKFFRKNASLAPRRSGFDSRRLHQALVVSTASTRPLYGRGAGSTPAGGS